jgi:hypothetical protein
MKVLGMLIIKHKVRAKRMGMISALGEMQLQ